jgi:hypothetical protein
VPAGVAHAQKKSKEKPRKLKWTEEREWESMEANILAAENGVSDLETTFAAPDFLCETARGNFRFRDSIKNGARQSRAPLRALARTRAPAERTIALDKASVEKFRSKKNPNDQPKLSERSVR